MITPEQIAEAKKNGQAVMYNSSGKTTRILSKEETIRLYNSIDDEYMIPKQYVEQYKRLQTPSVLKKQSPNS